MVWTENKGSCVFDGILWRGACWACPKQLQRVYDALKAYYPALVIWSRALLQQNNVTIQPAMTKMKTRSAECCLNLLTVQTFKHQIITFSERGGGVISSMDRGSTMWMRLKMGSGIFMHLNHPNGMCRIQLLVQWCQQKKKKRIWWDIFWQINTFCMSFSLTIKKIDST